jgi:FixJ family two-component response regulator
MSQDTLSPEQAQAAAMIAAGQTQGAVAKSIGVSLRTITRWLKLDIFQDAIRQTTEKTVQVVAEDHTEKVKTALSKLVPAALQILARVLVDENARASDKLRAVQIIGDWAGLKQSPQTKEPTTPPEQGLKDYLLYLERTNGNQHN